MKWLLSSLLALVVSAANGQPLAIPAFESQNLVLAQPDAVLKARLGEDARPLADYIAKLAKEAGAVFEAAPIDFGATGAIVVAVRPGGGRRIWIELGDNALPATLTERLTKRLEAIEPVPVKGGPVAFAMVFAAWGGGAPITTAEHPFPVPQSWLDASANGVEGAFPDAVLRVVWPDGT